MCAGAVVAPEDLDWRELYALVTRKGVRRLRDSKQLSAQQRDTIFAAIEEHGRLRHAHALVSADVVDAIGIANAAREAAAIALSQLGISSGRARVLLDAGLSVSSEWGQEQFIRGDETIPVIALASVVAKVMRDRHMEDLALAHPRYGFERHKGYGTPLHYAMIRAHGTLPIHRRTFVHI